MTNLVTYLCESMECFPKGHEGPHKQFQLTNTIKNHELTIPDFISKCHTYDTCTTLQQNRQASWYDK